VLAAGRTLLISPPGAEEPSTMIRLLVSTLLHLAANAVGLLVAATILDGMSVSGAAFVIAVGIFTVVQVIAGPMIRQAAIRHADVLLGSTALVVTFVGLLVTTLVSDGMRIDGVSTWVLATVIVWVAALLASVVLPLLFVKKKVEERRTAAA
jgi:putative membrane protein